jgi:hypothetical protein
MSMKDSLSEIRLLMTTKEPNGYTTYCPHGVYEREFGTFPLKPITALIFNSTGSADIFTNKLVRAGNTDTI